MALQAFDILLSLSGAHGTEKSMSVMTIFQKRIVSAKEPAIFPANAISTDLSYAVIMLGTGRRANGRK